MTVKSTIDSMADSATRRAGEAASASADWARSASSEAAAQTARAAGEAYDQGERAIGVLGRYIEERPVASVLAAFGLGLLAAGMLRSRH